MRSLPSYDDRAEFDALVVRTDFSDEQAWQDVVTALAQPWRDGDPPSTSHRVSDPAWDGASVDDVLAALGDDGVSIVFVADATTMHARHHPLLAVNTSTRADYENEADYAEDHQFGREFRIVPHEAAVVHANLALANMDFWEFAGVAVADADGVYRGNH
jgi:catechol 2,3-dioxygenase-like lactoylglutathione lyase family enzyme